MNNKIVNISKKEAELIKKTISVDKKVYYVEINGNRCKKLSDYLYDVSKKFCFPMIAKSLDGYNDWLTDLSWLHQDEIVLMIVDYTDFLKYDFISKGKVMNGFKNLILPWWEKDVCSHVVSGEPKKIVVYLVD